MMRKWDLSLSSLLGILSLDRPYTGPVNLVSLAEEWNNKAVEVKMGRK
jgi:hypothetical protein